MAVELITSSNGSATKNGIEFQFTAYLYADPEDPTVTPYLSISSFNVYASTEAELKNKYLIIYARVNNGTARTFTPGTSGNVLYNSSKGKYYRYYSVPEESRQYELEISPGDSFSVYASSSINPGSGTVLTTVSGILYYPKTIRVTAPATVKTSALNLFTCDSFTIPDEAGVSVTAYGYYTGSFSSRKYFYLNASTLLSSSRGQAITQFYWYPNHNDATSELFPQGTGQYTLNLSVTKIGGSFPNVKIFNFELPTGDIIYNETLPTAALPTIALTRTEVSGAGLLARYGKFLKGKSQIRCQAACTYRFGATESRFSMTVGYTYQTAKSYTFWPSADGSVVAECEDDHDGEAQATASYQVYDYWDPALPTFAIHRCDQSGVNNDYGDHVKIEWGISVAPLGNQNSKALVITHPEGTTSITPQAYDSTGTLIVAANTEQSYDITISLTDDFTTVTRTTRLSTAGAVLDIYQGGKGIAFGKVAEYQDTLEVTADWDVILNTTNSKKINLVDALKALAQAAGVDIYVQENS